MSVVATMETIQEKIFKYDVKEMGNMLADLVEQLTSLLPGLEEQRIAGLNEVLGIMMTAMQNSDYLLVADVLKYELEPFVNMSLA